MKSNSIYQQFIKNVKDNREADAADNLNQIIDGKIAELVQSRKNEIIKNKTF